jgi:predicted nucleic acid-binding Zn ribbon protein
MRHTSPLYRIERLRRSRTRGERDLSIAGPVEASLRLIKQAEKTSATLAKLEGHWDLLVPAAIAQHARPVSLSRGVLSVNARDAAAAFTLDRWLRSGGIDTLRRGLAAAMPGRVPLVKVKPIVRSTP